ncbi:MAG: hypothetical protein KAS72_00955 [Phycisphaerales bacterium]|nr:hypothetical protein [Phycisphaerales bacterium]
MDFRAYNADRDLDATQRIWREVGWVDENQQKILEYFIPAGRAMVADVQGAAECVVTTMLAEMRYLKRDIPTCCMTSVTTGHIARKQGLAGRLTAETLALDVADGAAVAILGIFDQGFYDKLGFGTGTTIRRWAIDPAVLRVEPTSRVPGRLTKDDWRIMHANRLKRVRRHGNCTMLPVEMTRAELEWTKKPVGFGFFDEASDELTHHMWLSAEDGMERGPYDLAWMAYETTDQFYELLGFLKTLADQVHGIRMAEPSGIQLQALMDEPFRRYRLTAKGAFDSKPTGLAYWQIRICDLHACLAKTKLRGASVRFNLELADPIDRYLSAESPWQGIGGEYVVTLGPTSGAELGRDGALPTLRTTVAALTRLWLGVRPATGLAVTDDLSASEELLDQLDAVLCLPEPLPDWDF